MTAPAQWRKCVARRLDFIISSFHQCKTDPCLWVLHERHEGDDLHGAQAGGKRRLDDVRVGGDETNEQWADALHAFTPGSNGHHGSFLASNQI